MTISISAPVSLMGFVPFLRKELREWRTKRVAIAFFLVAALLGGVALLGVNTFFLPQGVTPTTRAEVITNVMTMYANNAIWITLISIFSAMGVMVRERESGTLAWSLSKPLSRSAVLAAKWLGTTLMVWLLGIVLQGGVLAVIEALHGPALPNLGGVLMAYVGAFCAIGFWVLLCLLLSCLLKETAGVGAGALLVSVAPLLLDNLPLALQPLLTLYPTHFLDWAIARPIHGAKLWGYVLWMAGMAIATQRLFSRQEL